MAAEAQPLAAITGDEVALTRGAEVHCREVRRQEQRIPAQSRDLGAAGPAPVDGGKQQLGRAADARAGEEAITQQAAGAGGLAGALIPAHRPQAIEAGGGGRCGGQDPVAGALVAGNEQRHRLPVGVAVLAVSKHEVFGARRQRPGDLRVERQRCGAPGAIGEGHIP